MAFQLAMEILMIKTRFGVSLAKLALTLSATGLLAVSVAEAAPRVCGEREKMTKFLNEKYQETPRAIGVSGSGKAVMEIYTSTDGTWTVLMTMTSGKTCIMGAGHSWEDKNKLAYLPKT